MFIRLPPLGKKPQAQVVCCRQDLPQARISWVLTPTQTHLLLEFASCGVVHTQAMCAFALHESFLLKWILCVNSNR